MSANDISPEWLKQRLQSLSAVEPPVRLKERLLAAVGGRTAWEAPPWHVRLRPGARGWVGIAATVVVLCGVALLRPAAHPPARPLADANSGLSTVLAADHNAVRPADINALDSNGL